MGGIPQDQKKILVSSFAASVQRNQFGTNRKQILLHRTVKSNILDVSESFWMHLWSDPNLEYSGQTSLLLQRQIRGYKTLDQTTKHPKAIPQNLVLHIYKRTNTHMNTSIDQMIAGAFFFSMRYCTYSTNTKGENKHTRILQKGGIRFYSKRRELSHDNGILHMADKVSPEFCTQKNCVKNATVTQRQTATTLCPVRIWAEIIVRLESYSRKTHDTPVNTDWAELQKQITSPMTTKSLRSGTFYFVK